MSDIPEINLKMESKIINAKSIKTKWIVFEPPYLILVDEYGEKKVWSKNKKKLILWFLYKITNIKFFLIKYNEQPR